MVFASVSGTERDVAHAYKVGQALQLSARLGTDDENEKG
jgi:hypothetical protein